MLRGDDNSTFQTFLAGTPGNRTQLCRFTTDNGFEGRGGHQPLNHSQIFTSSIIYLIGINWPI